MRKPEAPKPLVPGRGRRMTDEDRARALDAYRKKPGPKHDPRTVNLRKPHLHMTKEQRDVADAVGMGPRQGLLLVEHPVCDRCGKAWDVVEARRMSCSACNLTVEIDEGMDRE